MYIKIYIQLKFYLLKLVPISIFAEFFSEYASLVKFIHLTSTPHPLFFKFLKIWVGQSTYRIKKMAIIKCCNYFIADDVWF